jgi:uncharacterized membrane protein
MAGGGENEQQRRATAEPSWASNRGNRRILSLSSSACASLVGIRRRLVRAEGGGVRAIFGTPVFLIAQTVIVAIWVLVNIVGWWVFDVYPFILLNLAFSLQAAYAAPLILLAQTRQADRDKVMAMADAQHREDLHQASEERQRLTAEQTALLVRMLDQNTQLTEAAKALTERIESLTAELHKHILESNQD